MNEIQKLEMELYEKTQELQKLREKHSGDEVKNYEFNTTTGTTTLLDLFQGKDTLFLVHNMGQGCRYCTLWADGFNAFLPHLEENYGVALVSKDSPETQRRFANERGWRFLMASHSGADYLKEQSVGDGNTPGMVCYTRKGDTITRKNWTVFGPNDQFCSFWHFISLAGDSAETVTPQFNYWRRPEKMDDGGQNLN